MTHYGAYPDDWFQWDVVLGCTADLLPVVCRPDAPISPSSNLTAYGKVPSRYDRARRVVGFPAWTQHQASDADLTRWSSEQDYGICLQTRRIRALDVDVTDPALANRIQAFLQFWGERQLFFPIRSRKDSSKFLVLFRLSGDYAKQTLQTEHGMIEFLATGQHCVVAGTHKDGARYEWAGLTDGIPTLTPEEWEPLKADLRREFGLGDWSEPRLRASRGLQSTVDLDAIEDPVVAYASNKGLILRTSPDGRLHVHCPWESDHTAGTDPTASTYFPAGTGGYETGHYLCLHAHCAAKTTADFLLAIGYTLEGFEDLTKTDEYEVLDAFGVTDSTPSGNPSPTEVPNFERNLKTGKIKWTLPNVVLALQRTDWSGFVVSWDSYTARLMVVEPTGARRPFTDNDYTQIAMRFYQNMNGFDTKSFPLPLIRSAVHQVAEDRAFDSAQEWLHGLPPWDGLPRVDAFCERYLGAEPGAYSQAVSRYWWTAHAGRVLVPGIQADMAIVLISSQGTGKTTSIKAMVPSQEWYTELALNDKDADLARAMMGKLVGEIAELRGLNSREQESIKAWVSRSKEEWTPKFMENRKIYQRRLVLVGTSNHEEFLADETGNRRWLPLHVGPQQDRDGIARDRDQLWAEARVLFDRYGVAWENAQQLARLEHQHFEIRDPWESAIDRWLDQSAYNEPPPRSRDLLTPEEVLTDALHFDLQKIHLAEKHRVGRVLRALGLYRTVKKVEGRLTRGWTSLQVTK